MEQKKWVITIGRQFGSGGHLIGRRLADELGFEFFDKELFKLDAIESGIGECYFHMADEKAGSHLLYKVMNNLKPSVVTADNLFEYQSSVIAKLADSVSCVIVGRCADYILANTENTIKVFLYTDMNTRLDRVKELEKLNEKDSMKMIKRIDKEREEYYQYYTNLSWGDMSNYDLAIDTGKLGIDPTVALIKQYIGLKAKNC